MAENKTKPTRASVAAFINAIDDPQKRADARKVAAMLRKATGKRAKMWGPSIVGYGTYHYKYASGREGDFMMAGFSPRKQALTVYIMAGAAEEAWQVQDRQVLPVHQASVGRGRRRVATADQ